MNKMASLLKEREHTSNKFLKKSTEVVLVWRPGCTLSLHVGSHVRSEVPGQRDLELTYKKKKKNGLVTSNAPVDWMDLLL